MAAALAGKGHPMTIITDEFMRQMQEKTKEYCVCIVRTTPKRGQTGANRFVTEHNRRNFALRAQGPLAILFQISDGSGVSDVSIFNASVDEVKKIMDADPAVKEGIFTYELHAGRSLPGDTLPK
jgi:hypothetical protein